MATFPDNLPLQGVNIVYQLLIFFGILYIISTAITARLITRKRITITETVVTKQTTNDLNVTTFDNPEDQNTSLMVEVYAASKAIDELIRLKESNNISDNVFITLSEKYNKILDEYGTLLPEEEPTTTVVSDKSIAPPQEPELPPIEDNLLDDILDEDDDEFLKPRSKSADLFTAPKPASPPSGNLTPPSKPMAPKPAAPKPMAPKPLAPKPAAPKPMAPKPVAPSVSRPTTPKPVSPSVVTPTPKSPMANSPQPASNDDTGEKKYAKSTSIAAIRMDMLRELARLKKLINEDE